MQITIDSKEPLSDVLRVIGTLYDVTLTTFDESQAAPSAAAARSERPTRSTRPAATRRRGRQSTGRKARGGGDAKAIREWASENGFEVSARGTLPAAVREAYQASH